LRILACAPGPNFSVQDLHVGYVEALRNAGQHVIEYPLGSALTFYDSVLVQAGPHEFRKALTGEQATELAADRLAGALWKTRPDILIITSGFFIDPTVLDLARRDGTRIVLIATEQPYELTRELDLATHCDITLLTDPINIHLFTQVTNAVHAPHAYRATIHTPGPGSPELQCDMAFIATGYDSRIAFLETMDLSTLDIVLAGNWQRLATDSPLRPYVVGDVDNCLDNVQTVDIYRSMRCGLNIYRKEAEHPDLTEGWAVGPREVEMAACGAFFLRESRAEGNELFPTLPTFTSPEEASQLLRYWLSRPAERADAAAKAREAIQDRTFDANAAALLRLLEGE